MRIYVHGNCQARALGAMLQERLGPRAVVDAVEVFAIDLATDRDRYVSLVRSADVILTQPIADRYRETDILSTSWVDASRRRDARLLRFPVIYFRALLPQIFTLGNLAAGRFAYHDAHAIDYFLAGRNIEDFVSDTDAEDFLPPDFVRSEAFATTQALVGREYREELDVRVSDLILHRFRDEQLLYTVNHPSRALLGDVLDRVGRLLDWDAEPAPDGPDYLDFAVLPPYRSALRALDHSGRGVRPDAVRWDGVWHDRSAFYAGIFAEYERIGAAHLRACLAHGPELHNYLARFRQARR